MPNLVAALKELRKEKADLEAEYKSKLIGIDTAILAVQRINTTCEKCEGKGKILRTRACAEDDRPDPNDPNDWITCPDCHGSGHAITERERKIAEETASGSIVKYDEQERGLKIGDFQFR